MTPLRLLARTFLLSFFVLLASCGSGDAPPPPESGPATPAGPVAPTITQQPVDASVLPGDPATFTVAATGTEPLSYRWQRNGTDIAGATSPTFTLTTTAIADSGATFRAIVSNIAGSAMSNTATLTVSLVNPVLTISPQPTDQTTSAGASATFTVGGTCSNGTLAVQWQRLNGSTFNDIGGATATTYTFVTAQADNGAQFRAVLSCSGQSVTTSGTATLTVNAPTGVTLSLVPVNGLRDQSYIDTVNGIEASPLGGWDFASSNVVRHLAADLSSITIVAGSHTASGSADGAASSATFNNLLGVTHDATGVMYVTDSGNQTIRRIALDGTVSTVAGTVGTSGFTNGTGSAASFNTPWGIAFGPDGDLYVADNNNHVIRRVTTAGVVTTYAGSGTVGFADDPVAANAQFRNPSALVVAPNGDLYVADSGNQRIRRIARSGNVAGAVTTLAGSGSSTSPGVDATGTAAGIPAPYGLTLSGSTLYVMDIGGLVRKVDIGTGVVTTFAGSRTLGTGYADGPLGAAQLAGFAGDLAVGPSGGLVAADNGHIRTIDTAGNVFTIAAQNFTATTEAGIGVLAQLPFLFGDLTTTNIVVDTLGRTMVSENGIRTVRRIDSSGTVSLVAGLAFNTTGGIVDGVGSAAKFVDNGFALGLAPDGTLYTNDSFGVRRITPDGTTILLAGSTTTFGAADGNATTARFNRIAGLAVGPTGDVFAGDFGNNAIRRIDAAGNTTTYAGALGTSGFADGPRLSARFQFPRQLAFAPDGTLYVNDNGLLRRIATDGTVSTVPSTSGVLDVTVDPAGTVYVSLTSGTTQILGTIDPATGTFTPLISSGSSVVLGSVSPRLGPQIGSISARGIKQVEVVSQNRLLLVTLP